MTQLTKGKYKGRLVSEVLQEDPDYIVWAYDNLNDDAITAADWSEAIALCIEQDMTENEEDFTDYGIDIPNKARYE